MSTEEYDLRKSEKDVGQLYPVLLDKKGRVIDGLHRLNVNTNWRTETLERIDSEEKFLKARIISNLHRRIVPASEIRAWINALAEISFQKGIKAGEIANWIADETGYSAHHVRTYLDDKYKIETSPRGLDTRGRQPPSPIEEAEKKLGHETFIRLKSELRDEVKQELSRDPDFIIETIETAPIVLPTLPEKPVDREGYYVPVITERQAKEMKEVILETEKELKERRSDPAVQERGKVVKNWMAHGNVLSVASSLRCPICGSDSSHLIWRCHPELDIYESHKAVKEKLER